jgi:hypothetical protein
MRLIKVDTFELEEFMDHRSTRYAILSHTWGQKEVTFADMQRGLPHAEALPSFEKIRGACRRAAIDGFKFIWVDTCCIDKSSSAELSEAINSMFRWYADAGICYAYLSDVEEVGEGFEAESQFRKSRWFTRGWTLQELIAPKKVIFYSRGWVRLGSKKKFEAIISEITGIDSAALHNFQVTSFSIAERMSWASDRVTTRPEDIAYCLLGLFGVNMSLLYGEGERAFIRLEETIIESSDDHSIFAWTLRGELERTNGGLLATSPLQFKHSGSIIPYQEISQKSRPYLKTNKGLSIKMDLLRGNAPQQYFALLDCRTIGGWVIAICLREVVPSRSTVDGFASAVDQFTRVRCDELYAVPSRSCNGTVGLFVRQSNLLHQSVHVVSTRGKSAFVLDDISLSFRLSRVLRYSSNDRRPDSRVENMVCVYGTGGRILVDIPQSSHFQATADNAHSGSGWVATAVFRSTSSRIEARVMLGWTGSGVSIHICEDSDDNSDGNIDVNVTHESIMKRRIPYQIHTLEGEETKLINVSVTVDTLRDKSRDALYKELYKVTIADDRYIAAKPEQKAA